MDGKRISRRHLIRMGTALGLGSVGAFALTGCGTGGESAGGGETAPPVTTTVAGSGPKIAPGEDIAAEGDVAPNSSVAYINAETGQPEVLVRLEDGEFVAYSAVCTHQQCTVAYQPQTRQLACPCHGGVYDPARSAAVVSGPPPRPLPRAEIEARDGKIFRA